MKYPLDPPRTFETSRLLLRVPQLQHAPAIFSSYASIPHIPRYMSWVAHTDVGQTEQYLHNCVAGWNDKNNFEYVIELREQSACPIGMIGMHPLNHAAGFGYVLAEEFWNRGLMTEALAALVNWSLKQDRVFRAQAFCDVENRASARVMEKAGMTYEGRLRRYFVHPNLSAEPRDSLIYAKTR